MRRWGLVLLGLTLLGCYSLSFHALQKFRRSVQLSRSYHASVHVPPILLKAVAGEFRGLLADYTLIEAASIVGKAERITDAEWDTIGHLFRQTMALDPYFEQSCHLIQGSLAWHAKRFDLAFSLLEESKNHRYWDWIPGYFIGFDYFFFLKDNRMASEYLMEASTVRDAPAPLATFAARLAQEAGNNQTAMAFLQMVLMKETDPDKKEMLLTRLEAHMAVDVLEKALRVYHDRFGGYPARLDALVDAGVLDALPKNPYGNSFEYQGQTGFVKF
ncbi:hypothetical protein JCM14469_20850 [Desulfatiferula olefinivorans]